ncbi:MAG: hypothetical protein ACI392_05335 [Paludibacteraceae bacterium]
MNVLFVSGHPAQVHNFRIVREELMNHGHKVFWLTTPKDIATNLLDVYNIPYELYRKPRKTTISQIVALVYNTWRAIRFIYTHKIDITISRTDPYSSLACFIMRRKHIIIDDTEHAAMSIRQKPFAKMGSAILVPSCFWYKIAPTQLYFSGNIELFYLHPNRFSVDKTTVYKLLNIPLDTQYVLVRFVKWDAYHDMRLQGGFSTNSKVELVNRLSKSVKVFISSESELPPELEKYRIHIPIERMHEVQACALLFVGESATMASESVVLGTPAIYLDEVGRGYTDEEACMSLLWMYRPVIDKEHFLHEEPNYILGGIKECIDKAEEVISCSFDRNLYKQQHAEWLNTKIDCTAWFTWFIENFPQSERIMRQNPDFQYRFK